MALGDYKIATYDKKIINSGDLTTRLVTYLTEVFGDFTARLYQSGGIFSGADEFVGDAADKFGIYETTVYGPLAAAVVTINDNGEEVGLTSESYTSNPLGTRDVPFENTLAATYYVAMKPITIPKYDDVGYPAIDVNPRIGEAQYSADMDATGELEDPTSVADLGASQIKVVVDTVLESAVDCSGRKVLVWLVNPCTSTTATAFQTGTTVWDGANNYVTISDLGQTAALGSVSTTTTDYQCAALGVTVKKNTDLRLDGDYCFLGIVTGAGSGVAPSVFDESDQRRLDLPIGDNAANIETLGKDIYDSYALALTGSGLAYFNNPIEHWWSQEHIEDDEAVVAERYTHGDVTADSITIKVKAGADKIVSQAYDVADNAVSKVTLKDNTGAKTVKLYPNGTGVFDGDLNSQTSVSVGATKTAKIVERDGLEDYTNVLGFTDGNVTNIPLSQDSEVTSLTEIPEDGIVGSIVGNYRRRITTTVGDGVTTFGDYNGADEIKTAVEAIDPEDGGFVLIKAGTYAPSNLPITIPSNVVISGVGPATKITMAAVTDSIFKTTVQSSVGTDGIRTGTGAAYFGSGTANFTTDTNVGDVLIVYSQGGVYTAAVGIYKILSIEGAAEIQLDRELPIGATAMSFAVLRQNISIQNLEVSSSVTPTALLRSLIDIAYTYNFSAININGKGIGTNVLNANIILGIADSYRAKVGGITGYNIDYSVVSARNLKGNFSDLSLTNGYVTLANIETSTTSQGQNTFSDLHAYNCNSLVVMSGGTKNSLCRLNSKYTTGISVSITNELYLNISTIDIDNSVSGMYLTDCDYCNTENITILNCQAYGILLLRATQNIFTNGNIAVCNSGGITVAGGHNRFIGINSSSSSAGSGFNIISETYLSGCSSFSNHTDGISVNSAENSKINNCTILNNDRHGVYIAGSSVANILVDSCNISGNADHGIYCAAGTNYLRDNNIIDNGDCGVYCAVGNNFVFGNYGDNNTTADFDYHGTTGNGMPSGGVNNIASHNDFVSVISS